MEKINQVLSEMVNQIDSRRSELIRVNQLDIEDCPRDDRSIYDRLFIDERKIDNMIDVLHQLIKKESPLSKSLYSFTHENGMIISNTTVPFGTVLIIYESRPDVTVEAAATALKSGNKILLKGGKEAKRTNTVLHACWTNSLNEVGMNANWIRLLDMNRRELQDYLCNPDTNIDLIIPRGGEKLIAYVKGVAKCPVLVSGRGNNFLYVSASANLEMALKIIIQSKISKISACNSLDKVLINENIEQEFTDKLISQLIQNDVEIISNPSDEIWMEEFLDKKIVLSKVASTEEAIELINKFSGKHSATIVSSNIPEVENFMEEVDCAAIYHNASTRFTDGFQFGLGAEMAISTEKLHHRGPLGIEQLVTNKWLIKGKWTDQINPDY